MIDAHEDVFARNFCGERVPYFYVNKMGYDQKCDANVMTRILGLFGVCKTLSYYNFTYDENGLPLKNYVKKILYHGLIGIINHMVTIQHLQ